MRNIVDASAVRDLQVREKKKKEEKEEKKEKKSLEEEKKPFLEARGWGGGIECLVNIMDIPVLCRFV